MREAVIVSTARTPLAKSHRGEFNVTPAPQLAAYSVKAAVERAGIDPAMIEDLILGCGNPEGMQGKNLGRQTVLRAELPLSIGGTTVTRFCASGLQSIAIAAGRIVALSSAWLAGPLPAEGESPDAGRSRAAARRRRAPRPGWRPQEPARAFGRAHSRTTGPALDA